MQEQLDASDAWNLETRLNLAMEALQCPPGGKKQRLMCFRRRASAGCFMSLPLQKPDILFFR